MARINVEDRIWRSPKFQELIIRLGNRHAAKGMVLELWTTAQEHWFPDRKLIPLDEFQDLGLQLVVDVGLAEIREGGVYAKGSEDHFAWLFERQEAGRRGGVASAAKRSLTSAKQSSSKRKQNEPSSSSSSSKDKTNTVAQGIALVCQGYPRKQGITPGVRKLEKAIKTEADLASFKTAITNYRAAKVGTESQYILKLANFANEWRDWIEPGPSKWEALREVTLAELEESA